MSPLRVVSGVGLALSLALVLTLGASVPKTDISLPGHHNHGCVNEGKDARKFPRVVCWLQRHLSWKSNHEPSFIMFGPPDRTHVGVGWPPYLVVNWPGRHGRWSMFRIGFRYDRNWHGYIFPTMALKHVRGPLRY